MTLSDLWHCVKKYRLVVVSTMLIVALAAGVVSFAKTNNSVDNAVTAETTIYANGGWLLISGIASDLADSVMEEEPAVNIDVVYDANRSCVDIKATGDDEEQCMSAASDIAIATVSDVYAYFPTEVQGDIQYNGLPFVAEAQQPRLVESAPGSKRDIVKAIVLGAVVGAILGVCIVIALQLKRKRVLSPEAAEEVAELPALGIGGASLDGKRLLANTRFSLENNYLQAICVVPVSSGSDSCAVTEVLEETLGVERGQMSSGRDGELDSAIGSDTEVINCKPLSEDITSAYIAQRSDATLVVVKCDIDAIPELRTTVQELRLAAVPLAGIVVMR